MVYSYRVGDLAIAIAYAMLGADDPLAVGAHDGARLPRAHRRSTTTSSRRCSGSSSLRLCASVCIAADQQRAASRQRIPRREPAAIARTLPMLAAHSVRARRGGVARGRGRRIRRRPSASSRFSSAGRRSRRCSAIDLAARAEHRARSEHREPAASSGDPREQRRAGAHGARVRRDATMPACSVVDRSLRRAAPALRRRRRSRSAATRSTSIARFTSGSICSLPPGTPVYAPLDGDGPRVRRQRGAARLRPGDHSPARDGRRHRVLHALRAPEPRVARRPRRSVAPSNAGDKIATLGAADVNGGWTPHLHLQIITDLLGLGTDFPGVARPSQRARVASAVSRSESHRARSRGALPGRSPPKDARRSPRVARAIGGNLSIAYREPVKVVRGWMQYLYDDEGRRYLDAYNNVPHVGHCHPRVVEAAATQMRVLNTNTRYLNDLLVEYADRLLATLPRALEVVLLRQLGERGERARAATRARVHGPARHDRARRGVSRQHDVAHRHQPVQARGSRWRAARRIGCTSRRCPTSIAAQFKRERSAKPARSTRRTSRDDRREHSRASAAASAAFIAETCPSVGGQLILPPGYLANVYEHVRAAGGVCIADEVQTGLGRMGTSFWAFEEQDVVPDIVVDGEAARQRASDRRGRDDARDRRGVRQRDGVLQHVRREHRVVRGGDRGARRACATRDCRSTRASSASEMLRAAARARRAIPDRRRRARLGAVSRAWSSCAIGETLEPAGAEASFVANRMRERGILLGTDGPYHNVVKIRPPMPFTIADGHTLVSELETALGLLP